MCSWVCRLARRRPRRARWLLRCGAVVGWAGTLLAASGAGSGCWWLLLLCCRCRASSLGRYLAYIHLVGRVVASAKDVPMPMFRQIMTESFNIQTPYLQYGFSSSTSFLQRQICTVLLQLSTHETIEDSGLEVRSSVLCHSRKEPALTGRQACLEP